MLLHVSAVCGRRHTIQPTEPGAHVDMHVAHVAHPRQMLTEQDRVWSPPFRVFDLRNIHDRHVFPLTGSAADTCVVLMALC